MNNNTPETSKDTILSRLDSIHNDLSDLKEQVSTLSEALGSDNGLRVRVAKLEQAQSGFVWTARAMFGSALAAVGTALLSLTK